MNNCGIGSNGFETGNTCASKDQFTYDKGHWDKGPDPRGLTEDDVAYSPKLTWVQDKASLLKDAVSSWKGDTTFMGLHVQDELDGKPIGGSGTAKIARAQAKELLRTLLEESVDAPTLYRGDNKEPKENTSPILGWTSSKKVAQKWAKRYGGQVYTLKGAKGISLNDVPGLKTPFRDEKEWIVAHNLPKDFVSNNCGIGPGGFQEGNTCAKGGGSGSFTPPSFASLKLVSFLGGSTGLGTRLMQNEEGDMFVVKTGNSFEHIKSENTADRIYEAAGVAVPKGGMSHKYQMSEYLEDAKPLGVLKGAERELAITKLQQNFALDATLANWDVIGLDEDNVLVKDGEVYRIDNGGALAFRAKGTPKGSDWNEENKELDSMLNNPKNALASKIFGSMTKDQIKDSMQRVVDKKAEILTAAKKSGLSSKDVDILQARIGVVESRLDIANTENDSTGSSKAVESSYSKEQLLDMASGKAITPGFKQKLEFLNPNGIVDGTVFVPMVGGPSGSWSVSNKEAYDSLKTTLPEGTKLEGVMVNKVKAGGFKISSKAEQDNYEKMLSNLNPEPKIAEASKMTNTPLFPGGGKVTQNGMWDISVFPHSPISAEHLNAPWNNLDEPSKEAIKEFTESAYPEIRQAFYEPDKSFSMAVNMHNGLKRLPNYQGIVYRGLTNDSYGKELIEQFEKNGIGGIWSDPAPHSTSRMITGVPANLGNQGIMLVMKTKTGKSVEDISYHPYEEEIIGMPETQYRVTGIHSNAAVTGSSSNNYNKTKSYNFRLLVELEEI